VASAPAPAPRRGRRDARRGRLPRAGPRVRRPHTDRRVRRGAEGPRRRPRRSTRRRRRVARPRPRRRARRRGGTGARTVDRDSDVAMVFQNYALYPHMTVAENLSIGLRLRRRPKSEVKDRVGEVAHILGLDSLLGRRPAELSGGQRQRVAMGRAMVREPQAYLMDEPLSNLDAKLHVQMRAELARIRDRMKTTTLYVTHDQVEAMTLGDRVAV